jgi:hypothetical protein
LLVNRPGASGLAVLCVLLCLTAAARGDDAGAGGAPDAGVAAAAPIADPRTAEVRALIAGTLAVAVEPQSLFDVSLADEGAVQIEAVRVRSLLRTVEASARPAPSQQPRVKPATSAAPADSTRADIETIDAARWAARIDLDRARLEVYSLPREQRAELLRAHAARREAARPKETDEERHAREAEQDRQKALEAAKAARSEAERLVAEEVARLIGVERTIETIREHFRAVRADLAARRDNVLGWQLRARDAKAGSPDGADEAYDALRRTLRASRDELEQALRDLESTTSEVPALAADPLEGIAAGISTDQAHERRATVEREAREARAEERAVREERASILQDEIGSLNRERLGLLPFLSEAKRSAITGFTDAGLDQARSETRHLLLVLRYHRHVVTGWIRAVRDRDGVQGISLWRVAGVAVPWLALGLAFGWWRRRSPRYLALIEARIAGNDRSERRTTPSRERRGLRLLAGVHRPLEWLLFFEATSWMLPAHTRGLLEVQLLTVIVGWTLAGAFIVDTINVLATETDPPAAGAADEVGRLRLQSLRLVGRVVVAFILILVLTSRLVGEGTIHSWVLSTCWFAAVPVFLLLVRWWRDTVFGRAERVRRKSRLQTWVLANRTGWKSFLAAMIAAVNLFALGAWKMIRSWIAGFELARRGLAYLFKREIDRLAEGKPPIASRALSAAALESLGPDRAGDAWVACPADEAIARLRKQIAAGHGGVVAIVGPRGLGKTALLRQLEATVPGAVQASCDARTSLTTIRAAVAARPAVEGETGPPPLVILDDAHALIKPVLRGLRSFDEVFTHARAESRGTLWIFALDSVVWPFLRRARDARPLFDEVLVLAPWTDEQIGNLLVRRNAEAAIDPTFEDLLEALAPSADEIDRQEALSAKQTGYFRMVWDYARGNPALALEVWRSSLMEDLEDRVRVVALHAPNAARLETLPDAALFILRAVLQMAPATVADVAESTRLTEAQVQNAFRFGLAHGYLVEDGGRIRVSWAWLRSVTLFLERRRLLVNT